MESQEVMEGDIVLDGFVNVSDGDDFEHVGLGENGGENLGDELLINFDSYWDDINDRLMISRLVSDSVIKGIVSAVEQEAADKIAAKELEVANLKEFLKFQILDFDKIVSFGLPLKCNELGSMGNTTFEFACSEHDKMRESLKGLRDVVTEQFKKLKKEIAGSRGYSPIQRVSSGSELVGLGGVLQETESENWVNVDRTLDSLKVTLENFCSQLDAMVKLSKSTLCEWHWEKDLQEKLEAMVMQSSIQTIMEEFEQRLWSGSVWFSDSQSVDWKEKFTQISNIRMELHSILTSLSHSETGQLTSHGSHDADHFHRRAFSNPITSSTSLWDGNGKSDGSRTDIPENFEAAQLSHLNKEGLVSYFNSIITKMRRDHESTVQEMTEEFFSLKREYLKERGYSIPHKKDKEFDALRKKIPEVILKLDDILVENEKPPASASYTDSFRSLKDRLDSLLSDNHQLRDSLTDKKQEVKFLSAQVAIAAEEKLHNSLVEANMLKTIEDRNSDLVDALIETALCQDVYDCALREIIGDIKFDNDKSDLEILLMQEIYGAILEGAIIDAETEPICGIEDSDVEPLIAQGISEVIFRETLKDAREELKQLYGEYLVTSQNQTALEMNVLEKENNLALEAEHRERLKQEIVVLAKLLEEKGKFAVDTSTTLTKEREQLKIATQELDRLREEANQHQILVSQNSKELELVKSQLEKALSQIDEDQMIIQNLNEKLEQTVHDLEDANEQREMAVALSQEKQTSSLLVESRESELRKQMEVVISDVQGMSKILGDFECKIAGKIKAISLRFEDSFSQLSPLLKKAKLLKKTGRIYQQRLERRCADLQMAEAEVDLLGDEVDKLLSLLEKIYIALEHYSPVLQHYPGVVEILKLIRRELSGESTKPT